jgi:hypothetical protein
MRPQLQLALILFGITAPFAQELSAAQVLAVSSNGKWAMVYNPAWDADLKAVSEQAISECKAKGGTDPKIVWSVRSNIGIRNYKNRNPQIVRGAVAISDSGNGAIVGWSFNKLKGYRNEQAAIKDCQKKGGQNPKVVAKF